MPLTLDHLRRYAVARTLFRPTTLMRAIGRLGFVQADGLIARTHAVEVEPHGRSQPAQDFVSIPAVMDRRLHRGSSSALEPSP